MNITQSRGAAVRERISRFVPKAITNYPFEILACLIALIIGVPLVLGIAAPTSLLALLPMAAYLAYCVALILGGATLAVGLRVRNAFVIASGLQLLGGSFGVYGLAVIAVSGVATGWLAFGAYCLLSLLAFVRALHFRRLVDIQEGATRIRDKETIL